MRTIIRSIVITVIMISISICDITINVEDLFPQILSGTTEYRTMSVVTTAILLLLLLLVILVIIISAVGTRVHSLHRYITHIVYYHSIMYYVIMCVYMYMYVYIYIYIYIHTHVCVYVYIYIYIHTYISMYVLLRHRLFLRRPLPRGP